MRSVTRILFSLQVGSGISSAAKLHGERPITRTSTSTIRRRHDEYERRLDRLERVRPVKELLVRMVAMLNRLSRRPPGRTKSAFERTALLARNRSHNRTRPRPYSWSEVIHRAGDESIFPAFERERPRIVNNFAASASPGYEFSSSSDKMNGSRLSNLVIVLESATNTQTRTNRL